MAYPVLACPHSLSSIAVAPIRISTSNSLSSSPTRRPLPLDIRDRKPSSKATASLSLLATALGHDVL